MLHAGNDVLLDLHSGDNLLIAVDPPGFSFIFAMKWKF